ncbi:MAG: hypothetical protein AB1815_13295 [Bacillota bacterium]|jgi:hypothetical protein
MATKSVRHEQFLTRPRRPERCLHPGDEPFTDFMPETVLHDAGFKAPPVMRPHQHKRRVPEELAYQSVVNACHGLHPSYWFQSR